jgi:ribosomal protein S12 methylthiotransferase accessory factor
VDLTTWSHPFIERTVTSYRRINRSFRVIELTNDLGLPVFAAVSESCVPHEVPLLIGFGAHLDEQAAILRAITELNQWTSGGEVGTHAVPFAGHEGPGAFLRRRAAARPLQGYHIGQHALEDIRDAVRACVERAAALGLETLVVDQTRSDLGLPVVRVVVPGLRHFWPRFGPGRLYTVPVRLKWVARATAESRLNPAHIVV